MIIANRFPKVLSLITLRDICPWRYFFVAPLVVSEITVGEPNKITECLNIVNNAAAAADDDDDAGVDANADTDTDKDSEISLGSVAAFLSVDKLAVEAYIRSRAELIL